MTTLTKRRSRSAGKARPIKKNKYLAVIGIVKTLIIDVIAHLIVNKVKEL